MNNIFIEGVQGSGKSTLLDKLSQIYTEYHAYREGDLSPCDLAWCSYITESEYVSIVERFSHLSSQIRSYTSCEDGMYIVAFTKVKTEDRSFYKAMESHEIYNARIPYDRFCRILLARYRRFDSDGNIFECALLQNAIETMMLFYEKTEDEIIAFYRSVYDVLRNKNVHILYLEPADVRGNIEIAINERTTPKGEKVWWNAVLDFFDHSPYAVSHNISGFDGFMVHLDRRISLEKRILKTIFGDAALILPSKSYNIETVIKHIGDKNYDRSLSYHQTKQ